MTDSDGEPSEAAAGVRRRDLLKATGLAAMVDLDALRGGDDGPLRAGIEEPATAAFADRLPLPARAPGGRYRATLAPRLDADVLAEPALLAGADAHAAVVTPRASVTAGFGTAATTAADAAEERGYSRVGAVGGRPLHVRRDRYRQRAIVTGGDAILVGTGAELSPVESLVRAVASAADRGPTDERLAAVDSVLDHLGTGTVVSTSPAAADPDDDRSPLATGERLSVRPPDAHYRTVAVYPSRAAATTVLEGTDRSATAGDATIIREGRALVRDETVPAPDLPLAAGTRSER